MKINAILSSNYIKLIVNEWIDGNTFLKHYVNLRHFRVGIIQNNLSCPSISSYLQNKHAYLKMSNVHNFGHLKISIIYILKRQKTLGGQWSYPMLFRMLISWLKIFCWDRDPSENISSTHWKTEHSIFPLQIISFWISLNYLKGYFWWWWCLHSKRNKCCLRWRFGFSGDLFLKLSVLKFESWCGYLKVVLPWFEF